MADFDVQTTAYGRPATELLTAQVRAIKGGDPLAPVTVVVPSNYAAVATRRALAAQPRGVANVSFLTLYRLAERLGAPALAAAGRRPISAPVLVQATRAALAAEPGVFALVADHPATELALAGAARELAGLTDGALDGVAAGSARAADVVRIARRVRAGLSPAWHDEHDLVAAATSAVRDGADVGPVVVHLLQELSPAGGELVRALAGRQRVRVNVGLTGDADADRHVVQAHARAGIEVPPSAGQVQPARSVLAISVSDPDEEVRAAVRLITDWMRDGIALGRVALLYGTADPYARILHEQLAAAGLPHNGTPVHEIGDMLLGRTLRRLLALPDRRFRRSDVMGVVTGAPVLEGTGEGGPQAPSRAWDRISRAAAVVDGDDWDHLLAGFARDQRARAEAADHEERDRLADHLRRDADRAEHLAGFVERLRQDLDSVAAAPIWSAMVAGVKGLIERYLGDEGHRLRWPDQEQQAADRVEEALERLAGLDEIEGPPPPTLEVFRRTLDGELEVALRRVGRFGDGVLVGHVSMAVGLDLDRVVVLGMAEGAFPARRIEDSLLHDDERHAGGGELPLRTERIHDDHRQLLAAMAAGETTLCFPRGDLRRQGDRAASRWLLADAVAPDGDEAVFTADLASLGTDWYRQVPSYAGGLAGTRSPATLQDLRLATMLREPAPVIEADPVIALGMEMARNRASDRFTRFDGNLAGLPLPDFASSGVVSATRLQDWAKCPNAFLMEHLLRVEVIEDPERQLEMNALEKGSLVHEILERFATEQIQAGRGAPWNGGDHQRLRVIAAEECDEYEKRGVTGRAMFWRRDRARIVADLDRFLAVDRGRPVAAEFEFRHMPYRLPDGRSVFFRGSVDRVDKDDEGSLRVIDYKTGSARPYRGLSADNPHQGGTHLQLAVYGEAAAQDLGPGQVEAGYWFVTAKGEFQWIGYPVTAEVRDEVGGALATIVDGIRTGVFPLRPTDDPPFGWVDCWYCSPDGLSTNELRRDWERKRLDPALAAYLALCEPEVPDDPA